MSIKLYPLSAKIQRAVEATSDLGRESEARAISGAFRRSGRPTKDLQIALLKAKGALLSDLAGIRSDATTAKKEIRRGVRIVDAALYALEDT